VSLQQRLNATHVPLVEDGNFDDATRGEAIHFQAVNDLTPDGVVGPKTQAALDAAG
jgi:peptidoglycan hydrolase-like protein with peptidoglycan-binding domain